MLLDLCFRTHDYKRFILCILRSHGIHNVKAIEFSYSMSQIPVVGSNTINAARIAMHNAGRAITRARFSSRAIRKLRWWVTRSAESGGKINLFRHS